MANTDIKRLNYFIGQFLTDTDFIDEQNYHNDMRRRLNRVLYSPGVIGNGFEVTIENKQKIKLGSGLAIDAEGRELIIPNSLPKELKDDIKNLAGNAIGYVVISYKDDWKDDDQDKVTEESSKQVYYSRIIERPDVSLQKDKPAGSDTGTKILIAKLELDGDQIKSVDPIVRQYANLLVRGNVGIGTTDPKNTLSVKGGLAVGLNYAGTDAAAKNNLLVEGNVGIGTTQPSGKLTVAGSSGDSRSVSIDSREIKFRGEGVSHLSIFGPDTGKSYLSFANTSSNYLTGRSGTDLMVITNNGNVGIGASDNLEGLLHVNGDAIVKRLALATSTGQRGILFLGKCDDFSHALYNNASNVDGKGAWDGMKLNTFDGLDVQLGNQGGYPGLSLRRGPKLGIGTMSPGARLEVAGTLSATQDNEALVGLKIAPTFQNNSMNGVKHYGLVVTDGNVGIGTKNPGAKLEITVANEDVTTKPLVVGKGTANYLTLLNNGNVGIGTTEPKSALSVKGGLAVGLNYAATKAAANNNLLVEGNVGIGTTNPITGLHPYSSAWKGFHSVSDTDNGLGIIEGKNGARLHLRAADNTTDKTQDFIIQNHKNTLSFKWLGGSLGDRINVVEIDGDGKIGIGATSSGAMLDVAGAANTANQISLQLRSGNYADNFNSNQITFGFENKAQYRHAIKTRHHSGQRSGNAIDFYVWNYSTAAGSADIIGGLHTLTLDGGNVGIGTTTPAAKLEVAVDSSDDNTKPLVIGKGTKNYLTMRNNGNVGIGTTNPQGRLDVAEPSRQGTGNITSSGTTVTGNNQTKFKEQLRAGDQITVNGQSKTITAITSHTELTVDSAFNPAISTTSTFTYVRKMLIDDGNVRILGSSVLEFGAMIPKASSAGQIGYQTFTSDALDIVGAGTTIPDRKIKLWAEKNLDIASGRVDVSGNVCIKGTLFLWSNDRWRKLGANSVSGIGVWSTYDENPPEASDLRLKTQLQTLPSALDKLRVLNGVSFRWNELGLQHLTRHIESTLVAGPNASEEENCKLWQIERDKCYQTLDKPQIGVIAQEIETVLPEAVSEDEIGYKQVDYHALIPLLIEAIKELDQIVATQANLLQQAELRRKT